MKVRICGGEIQVDAEDRGMIEGQGWVIRRRTQHDKPYVQVQRCVNRKWQQLARLLTDAAPRQKVVHLNGDRLDFRKENLRACTGREARVLGEWYAEKGASVEYLADRDRWRVTHQVAGKTRRLGTFVDETDARMAAKMFGSKLADVVREQLRQGAS